MRRSGNGHHAQYFILFLQTLIDQSDDFIVFDCPPAISAVTSAAALASDRIVIPVTPEKFSMQGLKMTFEELDELQKEFKKTVLKSSIIFNRFDGRKWPLRQHRHVV